MVEISDAEDRLAQRERLREAVMQEWDPIGVAGIPEARDEYDAYLDGILGILAARRGKDFLMDYLCTLETEHMGLTGDRPRTVRFAAWLDDTFCGGRAV